jgi:hypothetical protein
MIRNPAFRPATVPEWHRSRKPHARQLIASRATAMTEITLALMLKCGG